VCVCVCVCVCTRECLWPPGLLRAWTQARARMHEHVRAYPHNNNLPRREARCKLERAIAGARELEGRDVCAVEVAVHLRALASSAAAPQGGHARPPPTSAVAAQARAARDTNSTPRSAGRMFPSAPTGAHSYRYRSDPCAAGRVQRQSVCAGRRARSLARAQSSMSIWARRARHAPALGTRAHNAARSPGLPPIARFASPCATPAEGSSPLPPAAAPSGHGPLARLLVVSVRDD